ncbi:MAG TPA: sugar ABC transporter substrate-binding protein [Bacteroidota bacterium]
MPRNMLLAFCVIALLCAGLFLYLTADDASRYIVFSTWGTPSEIEGFRTLIGHYNATRHPLHPVKLSHSEQYQYTERLLVQSAALASPDIIHLDRKDIPLFVQKGLLEDMTPLVEGDSSFDPGVFLPRLASGCSVAGRRYAVPHNFSTLVLYYNRDHFDAAGIHYPDSTWTWETLLDAARRLTVKDRDGNIVRYGCHMQIAFSALLEQNGGHVLNDALDTCVIASTECADALQFEADLSEKYRVSWSMLAQNLQWDDMFEGGRLSMIVNGRWAAVPYEREMGKGTVDIAPLPRGRFRRGAAAVHVMAISSGSAKKREAWEFIKFLVSDEGERIVNREGATIPATRSIACSDAFLHHPLTPGMHNRVFLDELPSSVVWPFEQGPYLTTFTLQSRFELAMRRVLLHQVTPMQSLRVMQDEINGDIQAQRRVPERRPFAGSVLSWVCAALCASVCVSAWRLLRRSSAANSGA